MPVLAGTVTVAGLVAAGAWIARPSAPAGPVSTARATAPTVVRPVAADGGSREYATGPVVPTGTGTFQYRIATGDTELGIASRFRVCLSDVTGGRALAKQGDFLTPGEVVSIRLDTGAIWPDGTVHCADS